MNNENTIVISVDGTGSNEILKKHSQNKKNFEKKLLACMKEYEENNIEMEFDEWIELQLKEFVD